MDDMELTECGAVNLVRREGCPLKVTNADATIVYEEGKDFETWNDPKSGNSPWPGSFDDYHEEPPIVLTADSRIKDGDTIKVSYYHAMTTLWGAGFPCWLNEDVFKYGREQIENMEKYFKPKKY
ncbi:hypothetical protein ACFL4W_04715, partial [Planctomycetota bacterium]